MVGFDPAPHREARGNERWMLVGAFVLALGLFVAIVLEDYEPVKLAPVFMLLAWFPLIAWHEAGHAIATRLVGWEVDAIVVGFGGVAFAFDVFGVACAIKMYPLGGFVRPAPLDTRALRLKHAFVYSAGPLAEALIVIVTGAIVGFDALLTRTDSIPMIAAQAVCAAAAFSVVTNLVPRAIDTERGASATDGMGILRSLFGPIAPLEGQVRERLIERIEDAAERRDAALARRWCERADASFPNDARVRSVTRRALEAATRTDATLASMSAI